MLKKELKQKYKSWLIEVMGLLNEWDPYCLVTKHDCPKDEFNYEAESILAGLSQCESAKDVSALVSEVFTEAFHDNFTPENCDDIGLNIWNWWQQKK
ncbi:MAG: DUF1871 family protein [Pseudomonadota bacterium]